MNHQVLIIPAIIVILLSLTCLTNISQTSEVGAENIFINNTTSIEGGTRSDQTSLINNTTESDYDGDNILDIEDLDDDNDGMSDVWELKWKNYAIANGFTDMFDPMNNTDAYQDWDGDGYSNLNEYIAETNPYDVLDYPIFINKNKNPNYTWDDFLIFLILVIFITIVVSIIIGIHIIKKRKIDEQFWESTFGSNFSSKKFKDNNGNENVNIYRDKYLEWSNKFESKNKPVDISRHLIKVEVIGGPDTNDEENFGRELISTSGLRRTNLAYRNKSTRKKAYNKDPRFKGRTCMWCDRAITRKYIKKCIGLRTSENKCLDGPFCSKKCLNEHINTVPHYHEVEF